MRLRLRTHSWGIVGRTRILAETLPRHRWRDGPRLRAQPWRSDSLLLFASLEPHLWRFRRWNILHLWNLDVRWLRAGRFRCCGQDQRCDHETDDHDEESGQPKDGLLIG